MLGRDGHMSPRNVFPIQQEEWRPAPPVSLEMGQNDMINRLRVAMRRKEILRRPKMSLQFDFDGITMIAPCGQIMSLIQSPSYALSASTYCPGCRAMREAG